MNILLQNANVYDGTGADARQADVLIADDRIAAVGPNLPAEGAQVIDLRGLSLAPGFIDAHSHNDWMAIKREPLPWFAPFIRQGITSFVTGNCGLSATGFAQDSPHADLVGGGLFRFDDTTGRYGDMASFFDAIDRHTPCNIAAMMGHNSARAGVAGNEARPLTGDELTRMLAVLERGLREGACGLSLGLMYEPGLYAPREELKAVADLCVKYDRPMAVHPRACSKVSMAYPQLLGRPHLLRALDELHDLAWGTRLKLQYSHAIFVGRRSLPCKDELLRILEGMRAEGIDAMFDIYNETLGTTVITVVMPPWYMALDAGQKRQPLNMLRFRVMARASIMLLGFDFGDMTIAYIGPGHESYEGKTVAQIAREMGVADVEAYLRLCELSNFHGRINMGPYSTPEIITELSRHDQALYMTDGWVEAHGVQNPAIYDCFPKFLRDALLGRGDTLPRAVRKMTGATADRFSLKDRGYIRPGCFADLTVFDERALRDGQPDQGRAFGIERVFINGRQVMQSGALDEAALTTSGRAMRAGKARLGASGGQKFR